MDESTRISYSDFGHNFIRHVITAERIRSEIEGVLKSLIEGSVRKFPADMLVAAYVFQLKDVNVVPLLGRMPEVSFVLSLCGDMKLDVKLLNLKLKFSLAVEINLHLDVRTYAPLTVKLILHKVSETDIRVDIDGHGLPSEVLESLRIVGPIVREQIVREVNERLAEPGLVAATEIDVLKLASSAQLQSLPPLMKVEEVETLAEVTGASSGDEGLAHDLDRSG